jgi:Cdc6-like AAA superfamily ATPase
MVFRVLAASRAPGRRARVRRLADLLSAAYDDPDGPPRAPTVIAGAGGIGKTLLARQVARRLRTAFPDGQLFVDLRGTSDAPAAAADVLDGFLRTLGVDAERIPADADERGALFRTLLADRRTLIVLDDAGSAAQVRPLLPGAGCNAVLVTSRSRLPGLDGAHRISLD